MNSFPRAFHTSALVLMLGAPLALADNPAVDGPVCNGFGPQAPRDIDSKKGENARLFATASDYQNMNLCNIHFHSNAEHKGKDFSLYAGSGDQGLGGGFRCSLSQSLSKSELRAPTVNHCKGVKPGDTIEVHWVHSSCDVKPGQGLGACFSAACTNPDLRVETQVFTLVNDPTALQFSDFTYGGNQVNGLHRVRSLPEGTGKPVEYMGSTTGPEFSAQQCSPMQVAWSVRPQCAKLDINSISDWCRGNVFNESEAHGVRQLVTNPKLLSNIR